MSNIVLSSFDWERRSNVCEGVLISLFFWYIRNKLRFEEKVCGNQSTLDHEYTKTPQAPVCGKQTRKRKSTNMLPRSERDKQGTMLNA